MIKLITILFFFCLYISSVNTCPRCAVADSALRSGAVYDGFRNRGYTLIIIIGLRRPQCGRSISASKLWDPNNRVVSMVSSIHPILRNGSTPTYTLVAGHKMAKIASNGSSISAANEQEQARGGIRFILCCSPRFNRLQRSNRLLGRFRKEANENGIQDWIFSHCTNSTSSEETVTTPVAVYEANNEHKKHRVRNLFDSNTANEYKSKRNKNGQLTTYIIQYFIAKETIKEIIAKSNDNLPNFEIYGSTVLNEDDGILDSLDDFDKIATQADDTDLDSKIISISVNSPNCYKFIVLVFKNHSERITLYEFSAKSLANGRVEALPTHIRKSPKVIDQIEKAKRYDP